MDKNKIEIISLTRCIMKTHTYILIVLAQFLLVDFSMAQTPNQHSTVKESVAKVKEDFNSIKNILKKKNDNTSEPRTYPTNLENLDYTHIAGGKISAEVVYLDSDRMGHFKGGKAIVHKGTASAMINEKGQFVFPYTTFWFYETDKNYVFGEEEVFINCIFQYSKEGQGGFDFFMNAEGKELTTTIARDVTLDLRGANLLVGSKTLYDRPRDAQGKYPVEFNYITHTGKTFVVGESLGNIRGDIGTYERYNNGWKKGYMRLSGEKLTEAIFDIAEPFSDGMAVVGQKDPYGMIKYGYINEKGALAIPFMFSIKPSRFSAGLAKVKPKDKGDFEYAFIDSKGEILFKQTSQDKRGMGNYEFDTFQSYGLSISTGGFYVLDKSFNIIPKADFFNMFGIDGISHFQSASFDKPNGGTYISKQLFSVVGETNPKIYFSNNEMNHQGALRGKELRIGFINLKDKTVVLPAFSRIGYFDPVSKLAYAEVETVVKNAGRNQIETTKGYINEKGEWVILQAKGSKW